MFGPVTTAMRPPSGSSPERSQSLATKGSPTAFSAASTTGWRPPSILKASDASTSGRVQLRLTASSASPAATSIPARAAPYPRSAIVGNVTAPAEGVGAKEKVGGQPHALGYAPGVEMPRQVEAERAPVPRAGGAGA